MRISYGLPAPQPDRGELVLSGESVARLARHAEAVGCAALYVTEHPLPPERWLAHGGHYAHDPLVTLAFAAASTTELRLHTNLFVLAYRNPYLAAKGIATLDRMSDGRCIIGLGAGYLEAEFAALGAEFDDRNDALDLGIAAMVEAWSTGLVTPPTSGVPHRFWPPPTQRPHPPLWIGGNSRRAIRRAVDLGDGWCPFPTPEGMARHVRTASLSTPDELAHAIEYATEYARDVGREAPLEICFVPEGLAMGEGDTFDPDRVLRSLVTLAEIGVTWATVSLPGNTTDAQLASLDRFASTVLTRLEGVTPSG